MKHSDLFEVIIIGGSYAGLSAAMALGRSLRNVLVIDSGKPCNEQTPHSQNFLTQDGKTPKEISTLAKSQVQEYETIQFYDGKAISAQKTDLGFEITSEDGQKFNSKKLIVATGISDEVPDIKGFKESWGISLIHCPYCHGYEYRGKKTGIIANGDRGFHIISLVSNLTNNLTVFTRGKADFTEVQREKLEKNKIQIVETEIEELKHQNGMVESLILSDGKVVNFDVVYGPSPFTQHSKIAESLGCEMTEMGHIKVDQFQKTNVVGLLACGDNSSMMRSVANAVYTGNAAGAMVNAELVTDRF
ncbi:NAD(P)/FAD-dependent oxidoreductase [Chryseobacterium sp. Leaf394]|uniref:NAD(P)/FAD-dependent oxidoreductase n=1 Tax=Chryseobacterium sp. Leaf394 TaxID=1736361 RepID=UPI0007013B35|nr:NAD(P)/FAD-dependent oxidoreductase [Chryseobacterium sp. Leaf394]KQS91882.1 pyridine nucleotide-disulfide oxidoreductase [Chryseobacterium sp. Leaf394]